MTEERSSNVSSDDSSQTRNRKKRKWDQPAESLVSAGLVSLPMVGGAIGALLPGGTLSMNPLVASSNNVAGAIQVPLVQNHANTLIQKLNLPKIQDELIIAREIVINDAESSVRYKLTKRQTQEEIQRCTGAIVITRGKYHPPNAPPDSEKPLYLHISAGAHLKDTTERILAVDRAAAMVDEMLKTGKNLQTGTEELTTCLYLGFDPDPSLNIAARVRGPNDQYINHIINETGVNVILRGRGSGNSENPLVEEGQEPLHLFLSGNDSKSLENAKHLAEHLLNTISVECGVSRVSSSKVYSPVPTPQQVYGAVPPPQQLVAGFHSGINLTASSSSAISLISAVNSSPMSSVSSVVSAGYTHPLLTGGTSYSGYGGIYPQANPLQQVAMALKQSSSLTGSITPLAASLEPKMSVSSNSEKEKRPPQKRKFQEAPAVPKSAAKPIQGSQSQRPVELSADLSVRNVSSMPAPKKFVTLKSNTMPPPPPRTMPPPPVPPKFTSSIPSSAPVKRDDARLMPPPPPKFTSSGPSSAPVKGDDARIMPPPPPNFTLSRPSSVPVKGEGENKTLMRKEKPDSVPDTLVKLMEYGDDDDDPDENGEEAISESSGARKPFWAL